MFTLPEIATPSQNFINLPAILHPSSSTPWRDTYTGSDRAEQIYVQPPFRNAKFDKPNKTARVNAGGGDDIIEGSDNRYGDLLFGQRGDDVIKAQGGDEGRRSSASVWLLAEMLALHLSPCDSYTAISSSIAIAPPRRVSIYE